MKILLQTLETLYHRKFYLFLLLPFLIWLYCFRGFFMGKLGLEGDALNYVNHVDFYTKNLSRGVYPLWDPSYYCGAPAIFFLRRIGEFNPVYVILAFFRFCGIPFKGLYLIFLAGYYALAVSGFYLLAKRIFKDKVPAFLAYVLLLFSSLGSQLFFSFMVLLFVPIVWFFYFLAAFSQKQEKRFFLGMVLCLGIIEITYIPFYFITIFLCFFVTSGLLYRKAFSRVFGDLIIFLKRHKFFTVFCFLFLVVSLLPGSLLYYDAHSREFVLSERQEGSVETSGLTVPIEKSAGTDILNEQFYRKLVGPYKDLSLNDLYLPIFSFVILISSFWLPVNKRLLFFFVNIVFFVLIGLTKIIPLYHFFYEHIFYFKYMRNIFYFVWLAILPLTILFIAEQMRLLLAWRPRGMSRRGFFVFLLAAHVFLGAIIYWRSGIFVAAFVAIIASFIFFIFYFGEKIKTPAQIILWIFAIVAIDTLGISAPVVSKAKPAPASYQWFSLPDSFKFDLSGTRKFPQENTTNSDSNIQRIRPLNDLLYYGTKEFVFLYNNLGWDPISRYARYKFIAYDVLKETDEKNLLPGDFDRGLLGKENVVFVPKGSRAVKDSPPGVATEVPRLAQMISHAGGQVKVLSFDANSIRFKTFFSSPKFLVYTDNYTPRWRAYHHNHPVPIYRANIAFKGIWVPPGEQEFYFYYGAPWHYAGAVSLMILFVGVFSYFIVLQGKAIFQKTP